MTETSDLERQAAILRVGHEYTLISHELRGQIDDLARYGIFEKLSKTAVSLDDTTSKDANFVSRQVSAVIRKRAKATLDGAATWFTFEMWRDTLLEHEVDHNPLPTELQLPAAKQEGVEAGEDYVALARECDAITYENLALLLHPLGNHQLQYGEQMSVLASALIDQPAEILAQLRPLFVLRRKQVAIVEDAQVLLDHFHPEAPLIDPITAVQGVYNPPNEKEPNMPPNEAPCDGQNDIADAISRLQDTLTTGMGVAASTSSRSFDAILDEVQYSTLSIPSVNSDAAIAMGPAKLADKVFRNLGQAVRETPGAISPVFIFQPKNIRGLEFSGNSARGGAAIIADEVDTIRPFFIDRMRDLQPEKCHCDDSEADQLIDEAEEILLQLGQEAGADTGPFRTRVDTLLNQLMETVIELTSLYGITLENELRDVGDHVTGIFETAKSNVRRSYPPAGNGSARIEIGFLDEDANDEALKSLMASMDRLVKLFVDPDGLQIGSTYARLVNRIDAIPPSVQDLRRALRTAGVSLVDQKASFAQPVNAPDATYELDRLLSWIDDSASQWHGDLMEGSNTRRDLRWLKQSLSDMSLALMSFNDPNGTDTPLTAAAPRNRFAAARRQMAELSGLLDAAAQDAETLSKSGRAPVATEAQNNASNRRTARAKTTEITQKKDQ